MTAPRRRSFATTPSVLAPEHTRQQSQQHLEKFAKQPSSRVRGYVLPAFQQTASEPMPVTPKTGGRFKDRTAAVFAPKDCRAVLLDGTVCGASFIPKTGLAKACPSCKKQREIRQAAESVKRRAARRAGVV